MEAGIILLWSGSIATIPNGYALCDGFNGTPNLLNQFIMGAGDTYDPNTGGGNISHKHGIAPDDATLAAGAFIDDVSPAGDFSDTTYPHFHGGFTDPVDTLPPYYALAYIMKL